MASTNITFRLLVAPLKKSEHHHLTARTTLQIALLTRVSSGPSALIVAPCLSAPSHGQLYRVLQNITVLHDSIIATCMHMLQWLQDASRSQRLAQETHYTSPALGIMLNFRETFC